MQVYRNLAKLPSVKSGRISSEEAPGHLQVYSIWSQRNLERNESVVFGRGHIIQLDVIVPTPPHQLANEYGKKLVLLNFLFLTPVAALLKLIIIIIIILFEHFLHY